MVSLPLIASTLMTQNSNQVGHKKETNISFIKQSIFVVWFIVMIDYSHSHSHLIACNHVQYRLA